MQFFRFYIELSKIYIHEQVFYKYKHQSHSLSERIEFLALVSSKTVGYVTIFTAYISSNNAPYYIHF